MDEKRRGYQLCEECNAPCVSEFKKVVGLRNSELLVFLHRQKLATDEKYSTKPNKPETFILHNVGDKDLKRADYIMEMSQYRTKCFQCKSVVKRVRSLLDELTDIKKNEVLGVCEHCKRANPMGKCRRCEFIVNKFLCNKVKQYKEKQNRFNTWISKVNQLLHGILKIENVCKHKFYKDSSALELEKLLQELKSPLEMRQIDISIFPTETGSLKSMTQSKEMLEELLIKLKSESLRKHSEDSLFLDPSAATSCICKYFMDKKNEGRTSIEVLPFQDPTLLEPKINVSREFSEENDEKKKEERKINDANNDFKDQKVKETPSKEKTKQKSPKEKSPGKENVSPGKEAKEKSPKEKPHKEGKTAKSTLNSEEAMMLKMMKDREKEKKQKEKAVKPEKAKEFTKVESLPELKVREIIEIVEEKSESVIECDYDVELPNEMIKGNKVVHFNPHYKDVASDPKAPLLFKVETVIPEPETPKSATTTISGTVDRDKNKPKKSIEKEKSMKGVLKYELSNRDFIENGFTILPTTKIMRRMNIYKMEPASPQYDWFKRHKNREIMFYDTSEKLAEIEKTGGGKWFYKNGGVALDYNISQDLNAGQRYVVYSSGDEMENGKTKPVTVLASFDFLGNGVVYDHSGNLRLKYNQSEGVVIDEKIAPPGRWKWHSLNDPPVLQQMFVDTHVKKRDSCMDEILNKQKDDKTETTSLAREKNAEMLAIEFENFVKEKADKVLQKFKPFQIRMKALKLNDQFSLRVLDQSNIYLLFREGHVSLKLNLGMVLINSEIIDTDTSDLADVATPYDSIPPKTPSLAQIQHTLEKTRSFARTRANIIRNKSTVLRNSI